MLVSIDTNLGTVLDERSVMKRLTAKCALGACPAVYEDGENLVIVGDELGFKELYVLMHAMLSEGSKVNTEQEVAVRVPRSLIANLKLRR